MLKNARGLLLGGLLLGPSLVWAQLGPVGDVVEGVGDAATKPIEAASDTVGTAVDATANAVTNTAEAAANAAAGTVQSYLSGFGGLDVGSLELQPQNVLDIGGVLERQEIDRLTAALSADTASSKNAQALTSALIQQGLLKEGERIVGFSGGKAYKLSSKRQ